MVADVMMQPWLEAGLLLAHGIGIADVVSTAAAKAESWLEARMRGGTGGRP